MSVLRPLPRAVTGPLSAVALVAWAASMGALVNRAYVEASVNLAADLARYGSDAQWRGVYYRGAKVGFTVRQVTPTDGGFEFREDGQLEMTLLGASTAAKIRTTAQVDDDFALQSFQFSLDPGTGPVEVAGRVVRTGTEPGGGGDGEGATPPRALAAPGWRLLVEVTSAGSTRTTEYDLVEPPLLALNMGRRLANGGLVAGARHEWMLFDPATLQNAPVVLDVRAREVVRVGNVPTPAFRVEMTFAGLSTTSWVTDTGEVVREESPLGLLTLREPADRATIMAVPGRVQTDLLEASAVVPVMERPIDEARDVRLLRLRLEGADLSAADLDGVGQRVDGDLLEVRDPQLLEPGPSPPAEELARYLVPEPFIESDAPEIVAEATKAAGHLVGSRARAEELTRYVNGLLDKKPTVGLPSARDVLRTRIGDCNEHTALYVAMARALEIPTRIAVGLVHTRGAFYYHAWAEVYLDEGDGRGLWLPVDPTFNQFPADGTHVRLARGGLDRQAAILPLIGRLKMTVVDLEVAPGSTPILVGAAVSDAPNIDPSVLDLPLGAATADTDGWCGCSEWSFWR